MCGFGETLTVKQVAGHIDTSQEGPCQGNLDTVLHLICNAYAVQGQFVVHQEQKSVETCMITMLQSNKACDLSQTLASRLCRGIKAEIYDCSCRRLRPLRPLSARKHSRT